MEAPDIKTLKPEDLSLVYSGKPGCGCGCNGNYYSDLRNRKRVLKAIQTGEGRYDAIPDGDGQWIFSLERGRVGEPGRYYWAYTDPARARVQEAGLV